jgi:hypothetical protein
MGCTIRKSLYSLESLSLSQGRPSGVLTPKVRQSSKKIQRQVTPLECCIIKLESINIAGLENIEMIRPCWIKIIN